MNIPRRFLPPTAMLAAFEAAARTGSFRQAAVELNYCQSAISRQIRALEARLGTELFVRDKQRVILTTAGESYARDIRKALRHIGDASLAIKANPGEMHLNLATPSAFGARWLIPRIRSFLEGSPHITINFSSRSTPFDFKNEALDCAIQYGDPTWIDGDAIALMGEILVPVASPAFRKAHQLLSAEELLNAPLLVLSSRVDAWERWFIANDVPYEAVTGPLFDEFETLAAAAKSGLGIALLPTLLFAEELEREELVPVLDTCTPSEYTYHFVWPQDRGDHSAVSALREWIAREALLAPPVAAEASTHPFPKKARLKHRVAANVFSLQTVA